MSLGSHYYTVKARLLSKQYKYQQLIRASFITQTACLALIKHSFLQAHTNHTIMSAKPHTFSSTACTRGEGTMGTQTRKQGFTYTHHVYHSYKGKYLQKCVYKHKHVLLANIHFLFQAVTSSRMQQSKDQEATDAAPRRITLTRGGLQLAVSFPANSAIRLQDGQLDRVLQREYCECKARSTSRETIKRQ
jgi:hypothetical protein